MAEYKFFSSDGATGGLLTDDAFAEVGSNGVVITNISDGAVVSEASLNKMATSIPTPFARLYLYDTAFAELNTLEDIEGNKGKAYISEPGSATLYHHLVSECLDMLEFIFEYGNDPKFSIEEWDAVQDTEILGASNAGSDIIDEDERVDTGKEIDEIKEKHQRLGVALRDAVLNTNLGKTQKIFIFRWGEGKDKVIVGGTSPYTLVYTSPNWRRNKGAAKFVGGNGNELFPPISKTTKVYSLRERSPRFRRYIYELRKIYLSEFSRAVENGGTMNNLNTYILNTINNYEQKDNKKTRVIAEFLAAAPTLDKDSLLKNYEPLKLTSTEDSTTGRPIIATDANVRGIMFFTKKNVPDSASDYMIKPTVADDKLPVETRSDGSKVRIADFKPLVLSKTKLNGGSASYWHGTPYNPMSLPAREENPYFERGLPGVPGNPPYPYLTEADLFEDKVMWLGYKVNKEKFFTGFDGDSGFLLPLKPNFFKFFTVDDLEKMVTVKCDPFLAGSPTMTVTVRIPVTGGEVVFSRKYEAEKGQYIDFESAESFKVGVFPFYAYTGDDAVENIYKVLLARKGDLELEFYNENYVTPLGSDVVSKRIRTNNRTGITEYYTVGTPFREAGSAEPDKPGTFKTIRVVKGTVGGFIVPKLKPVKSGTDKYVFCVDFGTANTNVAYAKTTGVMTPAGAPVERVSGGDIRTLDYTARESQMAMLNESGSEGGADDLNQFINSEFVPEAIGTGEVKFPIRTLACGRDGAVDGDYQLFGDLNISFQPDRYGNIDDYKYYSELKWGRAAALASMNIAFFEEIMWIIKNKVAQLGGNKDFNFYFTYPQTMSTVQTMARGWLRARRDVRAGNGTTFNLQMRAANNMRLNIFEGIAPWYRAISLPNAGIFHTDNFLNIDIGGGSTDAIYICRPREGQADNRVMQGYSFSAKFAANDLWGDGVIGNGGMLNGYVNYFESNIKPDLSEQQRRNYEDYARRAQASADIVSYLFSRPQYHFSASLTEEDKLKLPMLIHFAATIYYVGRILAYQQLAIPRHIRFSGMGSLYIKYLSEDPEIISELIKTIFNHAGLITDGKKIDASFADEPKKITAEGGVLMHNTTIDGLTDKVVRSSELNNYLYDGEDEEEDAVEITCGTLDNYAAATVSEAVKFIEIFNKRDFRNVLLKIFDNFPYVDIDEIKETFATGYDLGKAFEYAGAPEHQPVKDVLFFWPVKHAIHQLALRLANELRPRNN